MAESSTRHLRCQLQFYVANGFTTRLNGLYTQCLMTGLTVSRARASRGVETSVWPGRPFTILPLGSHVWTMSFAEEVNGETL